MAKKKNEKSENQRGSVLSKVKKKECPNNNNNNNNKNNKNNKAKEAAKQNKAEKMEAARAQFRQHMKFKCEEEERRMAQFFEDQKRELPLQLKLKKEKNEKIMNEFLSIGYVFNPSEDKLLDYYLRNKIMDKPMDFCPIKEVDVYINHPQTLIGKSGVLYFFTCSRPNEIQPGTGTDIQGHWILGEKKDVFNQGGEKVGVKQVVEYCEAAGHKSEYKIIEYQLDPAPDDMKTGPWFVCKLDTDGSCVDVHSEP